MIRGSTGRPQAGNQRPARGEAPGPRWPWNDGIERMEAVPAGAVFERMSESVPADGCPIRKTTSLAHRVQGGCPGGGMQGAGVVFLAPLPAGG